MATDNTVDKIILQDENNNVQNTLEIAVKASKVTYNDNVDGQTKINNLKTIVNQYTDNQINATKTDINDRINSTKGELETNINNLQNSLSDIVQDAVQRVELVGSTINFYSSGNHLVASIPLPEDAQITMNSLPAQVRDAVYNAMTASVYDVHHRAKDIFDEIDDKTNTVKNYTDSQIASVKNYVDRQDTAVINQIISSQNYNINGANYLGLKAAIEGACTQSQENIYYNTQYTVSGDTYTGLVNALNGILNRIKNTEIYSVNGTNYTGLINALTGVINKAKDAIDSNDYIVANTIYSGLTAALTGVLNKAKEYTDDNIENLLTSETYDIDNTSYTGIIAALQGVLSKANEYSDEILTQSYTIDSTIYSGIINALQGVLSKAKNYTDNELANFNSFNIVIVSQLPEENIQENTFYLIEKDNGKYEKWWYIDDGTGNKVWDNFGGTSTKVVTELPPAINADENIDYILKTDEGCMYYKWFDNSWHVVAGSLAVVGNQLPLIGNAYTDYYIENGENYIHYRYINGEFVQIGSADSDQQTYSTDEIDGFVATLNGKINTNSQNITTLSGNMSTISSTVNALQQTINSLDTTTYDYYATYGTQEINGTETENVYTLYRRSRDSEDDPEIVSRFQIQGGGGGGGSQASILTVTRITPSPYVVAKNDRILLQFNYSSTNSAEEDVPGTYTWKIGNRIIGTGNCIKGINTFDATEFCTNIGYTYLNLTVTDEGGSIALRNFTVQKIDLYIQSDFNDKTYVQINQNVNFSYKPHGNISKVVHFKLDGQESTFTTSNSGGVLYYEIPAQEHGAHLLEVWMTATINNTEIETNHIYKDIIWYDADPAGEPVIGCIYRYDYYGKVIIKQYDTFPIKYYVYDPATSYPVVKRYLDNVLLDQLSISDNESIWNFQSGDIGDHTLRIECKNTAVEIVIQVDELGIDVDPVATGLQIDFNPIGLTNASQNRIWSNANYHMTVSDNFDWNAGGYKIDRSGDNYFLVKAGTYVTFDYNMFSGNIESNLTKQNGAQMKVCFMVENVKNVNAVWLSNVESITTEVVNQQTGNTESRTTNLGIQLSAHQGWLKTNNAKTQAEVEAENEGTDNDTKASNTYLYMPYSEQDIIEMDINIDPILSNVNGVVLSYEDGVPSKAYIYDNTDRFYQQEPKPIKIGSNDCDIRIYRLKIYSRALTTQEIMRNFIADSRNSATMLNRYNRNCIYYDNENDEYTPYRDRGILDPEKLAVKIPNVKILMLEADHFTTSKKTFIKSSLRCIHAPGGTVYPGDPYEDNWYFQNGYHAGQGTTSDNYGQAGRNVDFLFNCDGTHKPSDKVDAESNYISNVTKGYLTDSAITETCSDWKGDTGKVALVTSTTQYNSVTSVPNNFFNLKVNIASSENMNNWLLQKRYNDFLPYISPGENRDSRIKNDMEFVPAILFIKETNTETKEEDGQIIYSQHTEFNDTNWHFYALGNLGDSKKTDYTRSYDPNDMNEFTIEISDNVKNNATFQTGVYLDNQGHRQIETFTLNNGQAVPNVSIQDFVYPITEAEWNNVNNFRHWTIDNEPFDGDHSFEPRYACKGDYRDGKLVNDTTGHGVQQVNKNANVWRAFYKWIITSTDSQFINELDEWCVRPAVEFFYAFTHYYTMMDNRAKNTFWHFAKTGTYREVSRPVPELLHIYHELINNEYVPTSDTQIVANKKYYTEYAFDLWVYDTDTALGINNNGELIFPYGKEDTDRVVDGDENSSMVFNGARSVFWCRLRDLLQDEIANTFTTVSDQCFNADNLINQFDVMQECYPEEVWRLDIQRKYLRTFTGESIDNSLTNKKQNVTFLQNMMQGRKKYQRRQWVRDQQVYFGTKYLIGNIRNDAITFRTGQGGGSSVAPDYTLKIVPFLDMYVSGQYGNTGVLHQRAKAGELVILDFSSQVSSNQETQVVIYCASKIAELADLSACYIVANPDFSNAEKLKRLIIGNPTEGYNNSQLRGLVLRNNKMLQELDIRNCRGLAGGLDLSSAIDLLKVYAENTQISSVTFAINGKLQIAHLPNTIETLTMRNLNSLTDFQCALDYLYNLTLQGGSLDQQQLLTNTLDTVQELTLYNINWTLPDTTLLHTIEQLSYSVLTGEVHITSPVRSGQIDNFNRKWGEDLHIIADGGTITQFLVKFVNDDADQTVLYEEYVDRGSFAEDPFEMGYISKPIKQKDQQYQYSFGDFEVDGSYIPWSGWNATGEERINGTTTIKAVYSKTLRTYTVRWWGTQEDTEPLYTRTKVQYGSEVYYPYLTGVGSMWNVSDIPTRKENENILEYHTFKGWDKLTSKIVEDTDVYAVWDDFVGLPTPGKSMKDMTPLQIYAVAKQNQQSSYNWQDHDYFEFYLGKDFNFDNVESTVIGEDYLLNNIQRDKYAGNNGYYFNGSERNGVITSDIRLFSSDVPSFTIAIDFQFGRSPNNADGEEVLLSNYERNPNAGTGSSSQFLTTGFKISRIGQYVYLQLGGYGEGDTSYRYQIGMANQRDIVVIRYNRENEPNKIYIYGSYFINMYNGSYFPNYYGTTESYRPYSLHPNSIQTSYNISNFRASDQPLTFGAMFYDTTTTGNRVYTHYCRATLHWCKIWWGDLGQRNCQLLATWPREKVRMEYYGAGRYELAEFSSTSDQYSKGSWMSNSLLGTYVRRAYNYYINNTNSSYSNYYYSNPRGFLGYCLWNAIPYEWQSLLSKSRVKYGTNYSGNSSYSYANDYLFIPAAKEVSSLSNQPYNNEIAPATNSISWMTNNFFRAKFYGRNLNTTIITTYITESQQPTHTNRTAYPIWSYWYNTTDGIYYMLVPGDMALQYNLDYSYTVDTDIMPNGGAWIPAGLYNTRSPGSSYYYYHYAVSSQGSLVNEYYYNSNYSSINGYSGYMFGFNI